MSILHRPLARRLATTLVLGLLVAGVARASTTVLFVGNSFFYGAGSAVKRYHTDRVHDLNGTGYGGVPALFQAFATQAGLDVDVSLETIPGANLDQHADTRWTVLDRPWDVVIMSGHSTLDVEHPGDPAKLVREAHRLATGFACRHPGVAVHLNATWSRADQIHGTTGPWAGQPVESMALAVRAGYDAARAASPAIRSVIPTGEAWNRAFRRGIADPDPFDGIARGQVNLWADDDYHASTAGYYLEALVIFGRVTGIDPRRLGAEERAADDLGLAATLVAALEDIAAEQLAAEPLPSPSAVPAPDCAGH
jgi:hypothetical protein